MPLFAAAVVSARRGRMAAIPVRVSTSPLWWLLIDEAVSALRAAWARVSGPRHAGLPLETVLEQLDLLGSEVVPVLRRELDAKRPAHVPDGPTHAAQVARRGATAAATTAA